MQAHDDMRVDQFHVSNAADLGFPNVNDAIKAFFEPDILAPIPDVDGPVRSRYRIKAACIYRRNGEDITLEILPHARIGTGVNARDVPGFDFFGTAELRGFVCALLNLVPPESRHTVGTFGVHAFRSFGQVVSGPHQDGFEFGCTYVADRVGHGAVSYLRPQTQGAQGLDRQLQPGEFVLYRDSAFLHGATELTGVDPHRDALVIQFDAPEDHEVGGL